MDLPTARSAFINIINSLQNRDRLEFLSWCKDNYSLENEEKCYKLQAIAEHIKKLVPMEGILPSEQQIDISKMFPDQTVVHVDSFLYDDDQLDALVEAGKLSRNYCNHCGSTEVRPTTIISHSTSIKRVQYIFQYMLPDLTDKVVLDVGSRFGPILYGAYICSSAKKIIGVEMNQDMCNLQNHIINEYKFQDRIEVICNDICNIPEIVQGANVIIFNNVFECFLPKDTQQKTWRWLRVHITPGTIVITSPSIEATLGPLETGINISTWLREIHFTDPEISAAMDDQEATAQICSYVVI